MALPARGVRSALTRTPRVTDRPRKAGTLLATPASGACYPRPAPSPSTPLPSLSPVACCDGDAGLPPSDHPVDDGFLVLDPLRLDGPPPQDDDVDVEGVDQDVNNDVRLAFPRLAERLTQPQPAPRRGSAGGAADGDPLALGPTDTAAGTATDFDAMVETLVLGPGTAGLRFRCKECGKEMCKRINMTHHLRTHTGDRLYRCSVCSMQFAHPIALTAHLQAHARDARGSGGGARAARAARATRTAPSPSKSGQPPSRAPRTNQSPARAGGPLRTYQSPRASLNAARAVAAQTFRAVQLPKPNQLGQQRPKRHHCKICNKWFTRKTYLNYHLKLHTTKASGQPRVWTCRVCGKQFITKIEWRMHMREQHSNRALLECDMCDKKFVFHSELMRHQSRHTGGSWPCPVCQQRFTRRDHLAAHERRFHPEVGPQAQEAAETPAGAAQAAQAPQGQQKAPGHKVPGQKNSQGQQGRQGDTSIACEICNKRFKHVPALNGHKRVHSAKPQTILLNALTS